MKFRSLHILPFVAAILLAMSACDDTASLIGSSLTGDNVEIVIDSSFTVSGTTQRVKEIKPKTTNQLIGSITINGYGTLTSEVVTQFLPSTVLDTAEYSVANLDSVLLDMSYLPTDFTGDSVAPLGVTVYELTQQLTRDISSAYDPTGKYNPKPLGSTMYNASTIDDAATLLKGYRTINVKLPLSKGQEIFNSFVEDPANFANGQLFSQNVFPGVYIANSFGSGRLTVVKTTGVGFFFTKVTEPEEEGEKNDTTTAEQRYMLVTPEVISNNIIDYTMADELENKITAGDNIIVAPVGTEIEFKFPIKEVVDKYTSQGGSQAVLNALAMRLPADTIISGVSAPPYLLMVLKKDRDAFFANNKLPDNKTSFYAEYNSTNGYYAFSSLRSYLLEMMTREEITDEDCTFTLVPVEVTFEQLVNSSYYSTVQYTESEVLPYLNTPVAAQLHFDKAKIQLTFSRLQINR